jgi:hypothetical protein
MEGTINDKNPASAAIISSTPKCFAANQHLALEEKTNEAR